MGSRWERKNDEEKRRTLAKIRGYPLMDELEEYVKKMSRRDLVIYYKKWLKFHKTFGEYDTEALATFYGYIKYTEKLEYMMPILDRFEKQLSTYEAFVMSLDKHSPLRMQHNATLQELLGPEATFDKSVLPDDYIPSWEKHKQEYLETGEVI